MKELRLSVLMPVYNAEDYLTEAVQSILNQTYRDYDFIIIDDGSADKSLKILTDFASRDKRIRLVSRPNKGLVKTLNEGLELITTPFVARMDADDIALPERFEKQMAYLEKYEDCLLLGTRVTIIDSDGDTICEMGNYYTHAELDAGLINKKGQLIYHPSVIFRKDAVVNIGGYREKYPHVEDLDLFLRLSEIGKIENLPTPLLKYREHTKKIGHVYNQDQSVQIEALIQEAYERRQQPYNPIETTLKKTPSAVDRWRIWAWWAIKAGNLSTARKYAQMVLKHEPFSFDTWRLVYCVLRGYWFG